MPNKKDEQPPQYVVMNPRGLPDDVPIITIDGGEGEQPRHYFAGDIYEGPRPEEFREEGVLVTPKQAEVAEKQAEQETAEAAPEADPESEPEPEET